MERTLLAFLFYFQSFRNGRLFSLYRKVLLWRTLDIKVARTEAGIANKR